MRRMVIAAAALALVLAGCEMNAEVSVNHDGSGTMGFSFAMEEALLSSIPGGEDPFAEFRNEFSGGPVAWSFEESSERGLRGIRATFPFSDLTDLQNKMRLMDEAEGGTGGGFGDNFRLEQVGDGWILEATGEAPSGADLGGSPPVDPSLGGDFGSDPFAELGALFTVSFRVTLPGTSASTNADETIDAGGGRTTFVWTVDMTSAEPVAMNARTTGASAGGFPFVPVGIGVVLAGAALMWVARARKPSGPPPAVLEGFGEVVEAPVQPAGEPSDEELAG